MSYKLRKVWNYNRFEQNFVVGDLVKLIFLFPDGNESMWVKITEATGYEPRTEWPNGKGFHEETFNTEFKAKLDNVSDQLQLGDKIEFSLEHIVCKWR